ncbi:MAG: three-Cys-motif partner protein TcmP [Candidatus Cloacimonas sp.]|jgi:three-Cys-motif partner protein|nr:three-Cys-motif partner protein TcmP [Candidatus Cloacimonas sp.]HNU62725.1 three-Cys-motif partner protein TcmP [Methanofastidiosum sp.]HQK63471.1 three-Cys-motif partner protein TcmP [Methanofastidiosum sp.]
MTNKKPISVPGKNYYAWRYKEHTKTKHDILQCYLEKWFVILGKYYPVNYFDCFGGCGIYTFDGVTFNPGSPILAAQAWLKRGNKANDLRMICIEKKKANLENLKKVFADYLPTMRTPYFIQDDFDHSVNAILDDIDKSDKVLAPSFFFVDPFGFTLKYSTIKRIMNVEKSEVFLNFMYDSVQRHLTNPNVNNCMDELFGCKQWKDIANCSSLKKEQAIIGFYRDQLKEIANFVIPFRVCYTDRNRTIYYLIHLTNNLKGASIMKSCVAETNNGVLSYLGKQKDQSTFFDKSSYKEEDLKILLMELLFPNSMTFNEIVTQLIDSTPYLEKEIRTVLKHLRNEGIVNKTSVSSKQESAIKDDDILTLI